MQTPRCRWLAILGTVVVLGACWFHAELRWRKFRDQLGETEAAFGRLHAAVVQERSDRCGEQLALTKAETTLAETRAKLVEEELFPQHFIGRMETLAARSCQPDDLDLSEERTETLDAVLRQVFPDPKADDSAEARAIALLRFVCTTTTLEQCTGSGSEVLEQHKGICGGMAMAFVALCRRCGLPSRKVGLYNLSAMGGHAVAVVYYDGGWHFFDPTFGTFFYSADHYPANGHIASFEELLVDPEPWKMFRVTAHPWSEKFGAAPVPERIQVAEDSYLRERFGFVLSQQYRQFFHEAFPIEGRKDRTLSFPLHVDLDATRVASLGTENESDLDLWQAGHYDLSPYGFHTLIIRGAKGCRVRIEYTAAGEVMPALVTVPLAAARLLSSGACDDRYVVTLDVNADEAIVAIFAGETVPLDSIEISKDHMDAAPGSTPPLSMPRGPLAYGHRHWRRHHGSRGDPHSAEQHPPHLPLSLRL